MKGCPVCGKPIKASIEVTDIDAFTCPSCYIKIADYKNPADLVTKLYKVEEYDPRRKVRFNIRGFITAMSGAERVCATEEVKKLLKDFFDTGTNPDGAIVYNKGLEAQISLPELVFELNEGEVPKSIYRAKIIDYVESLEAYGADSADRSKAYIARSLLGNWNPPRIGIRPLKDVRLDILKALKHANVSEPESITIAILRQYLKDMYAELFNMFEAHSKDSLLLLSHEKKIPDIRYGIMILENENDYHIYLLR